MLDPTLLRPLPDHPSGVLDPHQHVVGGIIVHAEARAVEGLDQMVRGEEIMADHAPDALDREIDSERFGAPDQRLIGAQNPVPGGRIVDVAPDEQRTRFPARRTREEIDRRRRLDLGRRFYGAQHDLDPLLLQGIVKGDHVLLDDQFAGLKAEALRQLDQRRELGPGLAVGIEMGARPADRVIAPLGQTFADGLGRHGGVAKAGHEFEFHAETSGSK
jgi:hypothetical protein